MEIIKATNWVKPNTQHFISKNDQQQNPIERRKIGQEYNDNFSASSNLWLSDFLSQKCLFEVIFGASLLRL